MAFGISISFHEMKKPTLSHKHLQDCYLTFLHAKLLLNLQQETPTRPMVSNHESLMLDRTATVFHLMYTNADRTCPRALKHRPPLSRTRCWILAKHMQLSR